jgi:outer membrane protein assembly factor BamB
MPLIYGGPTSLAVSVRPALAAFLVAILVPAAHADWASFHHDARNSGFAAGSDYKVYQDVWWSNKTLANAQIKASPVIKDGILVTADLAGRVRGLDAESGAQLWSFKMPAAVESTPAIAGERVYVVDASGNLKAINLKTGAEEKPQVPPASVGATLGGIREHEGKLFIGNEAGEVKAYLTSTLTLLWSFRVSDVRIKSMTSNTTGVTTCSEPLAPRPIRGAPAVYDGKVYFGSLNHYIFAVDEEGQGNGKTTVQWIAKTGDVVVGAPSISTSGDGRYLVVGSYDGKVYAFDPSPDAEGEDPCFGLLQDPAWTFEVPSEIDSDTGETQVSKVHSSPAVAGGKAFFGANNGKVYAIRMADGLLAWERTAGSALAPVTSSPAVSSGIVLVGSEDKKVYWLSAENGSTLKTFPTQAAVGTSPAIDGDRAYIAATDGTLYMFGPKVPPRPDLVVVGITATTATVTVEVKNEGDARAGNTTVRIDLGGAFLGTADVPALDSGQSQQVTFRGTVPAALNKLKAEVDPDNVVKESKESNNALAKDVNLTPPPATQPPAGDGGGGGATPSEKAPGAGILLAAGLLALAAVARRRRA